MRVNRMIIKPLSCTCGGCRHSFAIQNRPGCRLGDTRKKRKSKSNKLRDRKFRAWVRSIRRRNPLKEELPKREKEIGYTD